MYADDITNIATEIVNGANDVAQRLNVIAAALNTEPESIPVMTDIRDQMPVNPNPDEPWLMAHGYKDWWVRTSEQIDGITIHHVASIGAPLATAQYCTRAIARGGKGLPRTQYHFWIDADGEILYCLDTKYGCWHDSCGHFNTHISVALNGALHLNLPTALQLASAGRLVAWLMDEYQVALPNVEGHREWAYRVLGSWVTICPGWATLPWRNMFFDSLNAARGISAAAAFGISDVLDTEQLHELESMQRGGE
jgi:hypothetical protein